MKLPDQGPHKTIKRILDKPSGDPQLDRQTLDLMLKKVMDRMYVVEGDMSLMQRERKLILSILLEVWRLLQFQSCQKIFEASTGTYELDNLKDYFRGKYTEWIEPLPDDTRKAESFPNELPVAEKESSI